MRKQLKSEVISCVEEKNDALYFDGWKTELPKQSNMKNETITIKALQMSGTAPVRAAFPLFYKNNNSGINRNHF